jgi:TonB family protein
MTACRGCGADVPVAEATPADAGARSEDAAPAPSALPYLPARFAPDDAPAPESLAEAVLFKQRRRLNECYRTAAKDRPTLQGDAIFQVTIAPSGSVENVSVVSQTGLDVDLVGCATKVLKEASFPPHDGGGPYAVNVPIRFRPPPGGFDAGGR